MSDRVRFTMKINGSPDLVEELERVARANAADITVESVGPADQASHLRLGLTEVSTIVAIVNGIATLSKFAAAIYRHFKENKSDQLTVQTAVRTIVIEASEAVTPEQVRAALEDAVRA